MSGSLPCEVSTLEFIRRNSVAIARAMPKELIEQIAGTLAQDDWLMESEVEAICHRERTKTEAGDALVGIVLKKKSPGMAKAFMDLLEKNKTMKDALDNIKCSKKEVSSTLADHKTTRSTDCEKTASAQPLDVVARAAMEDIDNKLPKLPSATAVTSHGEISDIESYKMDKSPHGVCLIINNVDFCNVLGDRKSMPGLSQRIGSDIDADLLEKTFKNLGFKTHTERNLERTNLTKCLDKYASYDHSHYDSFVCCILTHGTEGHVCSCDSYVVPISNLTQPFVARNCGSLIGKPKLFFIQACQGWTHQLGSEELPDAVDSPAKLIPDEADFLIAYSTAPGYVSFRNPATGSFYIQTLCEMLTTYGHRNEILTLLTQVNKKVGDRIFNVGDGQPAKQMPAPMFTLRKRLFLMPTNQALPSKQERSSFDDKSANGGNRGKCTTV